MQLPLVEMSGGDADFASQSQKSSQELDMSSLWLDPLIMAVQQGLALSSRNEALKSHDTRPIPCTLEPALQNCVRQFRAPVEAALRQHFPKYNIVIGEACAQLLIHLPDEERRRLSSNRKMLVQHDNDDDDLTTTLTNNVNTAIVAAASSVASIVDAVNRRQKATTNVNIDKPTTVAKSSSSSTTRNQQQQSTSKLKPKDSAVNPSKKKPQKQQKQQQQQQTDVESRMSLKRTNFVPF